MKTLLFFVLLSSVFLNCSEKKSKEVAQDSVPAVIEVRDTSALQYDAPDPTLTPLTEEEELTEALEYEAENSVNTYPQNVDVEGEIVRFKEEEFKIGAPFFERNAVTEIPAFLKANNIQYKLRKTEASKDPDDYESTDTYYYTFGESQIEVAYEQVTSATIYSSAFEWDNVKVGMSKREFTTRFPYLEGFYGYNSYQLHIGSFGSACYVQFDFIDDKITVIKYAIFVQDCG